jgi:hypothetical protein
VCLVADVLNIGQVVKLPLPETVQVSERSHASYGQRRCDASQRDFYEDHDSVLAVLAITQYGPGHARFWYAFGEAK